MKRRTYPVVYAPARLERNKHAPATSSGSPTRPSGKLATIESRFFSSVAAIILDGKGPQASVLTVMFSRPRREARTLLMLRKDVR